MSEVQQEDMCLRRNRDLSEMHAFPESPDLTYPLQQDVAKTFRAMKHSLIKPNKLVLNPLKQHAELTTAHSIFG